MNALEKFQDIFIAPIEQHPEYKRGMQAYLNHDDYRVSASYEFNAGWEDANQVAENAENHESRIAQ